jgi:hypothetical protein
MMVTKNKDILDKTGFSFVCNEGRGPMDTNANGENKIKIVLENQMIQKWSEEIKKKSKTLMFYKDVKVAYGQEFYLKLNIPARCLTLWMHLRVNCRPISARFKRYSKERCSNEDKYTCPLCRVKEDYLVHCLSRCQGFSTIRDGIFGKK